MINISVAKKKVLRTYCLIIQIQIQTFLKKKYFIMFGTSFKNFVLEKVPIKSCNRTAEKHIK